MSQKVDNILDFGNAFGTFDLNDSFKSTGSSCVRSIVDAIPEGRRIVLLGE